MIFLFPGRGEPDTGAVEEKGEGVGERGGKDGVDKDGVEKGVRKV